MRRISIIILLLQLIFTACSNSIDQHFIFNVDTLTNEQTINMIIKEAINKIDTFPLIKYNHIQIQDLEHRNQIASEFSVTNAGYAKNKIFRTLNREELRFLRPGEILVIPDTFILDQRAYSIFPHYYWYARNIPKIIIVSAAYQCYACYEFGKLVRFAATNTGKEATQTYPGRYYVRWKVKNHRSSLDSNWIMPYTINFHPAGTAFHQFSMPGRPVSHSCCRQFLEDAEWLFYWVDLLKHDKNGNPIQSSGTPVLIIDHFDFTRKRGGPWLELKSNKDTFLTLPKDPLNYELAYIPMCQIPPGARWNLPGGIQRYKHAEDTLRARGVIRPNVKLIKTRNFNVERRRKKLLQEMKRKKLQNSSNQ